MGIARGQHPENVLDGQSMASDDRLATENGRTRSDPSEEFRLVHALSHGFTLGPCYLSLTAGERLVHRLSRLKTRYLLQLQRLRAMARTASHESNRAGRHRFAWLANSSLNASGQLIRRALSG